MRSTARTAPSCPPASTVRSTPREPGAPETEIPSAGVRDRGVRQPLPGLRRARAARPRWSSTPTTTTAPSASLAPGRAEALMWVWRHRYVELGARAGRRLRVHLREPRRRGRRHAAPPPRPDLRLSLPAAGSRARARRRRAARRLRPVRAARHASSSSGERLLHENDAAVAYVPYAARWAYEVHVACASTAPACRLLASRSCACSPRRCSGNPRL